MDQHVRLFDFFERGAKCFEKIRWKVADESYSVIDDDLGITRKPKAPAGRIKRGKHPAFSRYRALCQRIEQRAFTSVCVTDD